MIWANHLSVWIILFCTILMVGCDLHDSGPDPADPDPVLPVDSSAVVIESEPEAPDPVMQYVVVTEADTIVNPPPPYTRIDTLMGVYTGSCILKEWYLDLQTGQQVTLRDTQPGEIRIISIDTVGNGAAMQFTFAGLYFEYFGTGMNGFQADTIQMSFHFSVHQESVSLVPKSMALHSFNSTNSPSTFGGNSRECWCVKTD